MNWIKENPFLSGIIAVCVVAGGALGFLVFQEYSAYSDASEAYGTAVDKLHQLQSKVPFPNATNLQKLKQQEENYQTEIATFRDQLGTMQLPLRTDVNPQQFQDDLRTDVNAVRSKAETNGVKLPVNFYLGFDPYQSQLPSDKASPYLDRQLRSILLVVNRLLDFKVESIDNLVRQPLPEESGSATTPAPAEGQGHRNRAEHNGAGNVSSVFTQSAFSIAFTSEQGKLRVAYDSLLSPDQFFVIKALNIENTALTGPSKINPAQTSDAGGQTKAREDSMSVILGREKVRAALAVEIVDFPAKPQTKTNQP